MFKALNKGCKKKWAVLLLNQVEGRLISLKIQHRIVFLTDNNSTFVFERIQSCAKNAISHKQPAACGLSRISYAYLTWVAMWDRFFRQRAYIGITRSRMRWYVRKDFLTQGKVSDVPIRCARNSFPSDSSLYYRRRQL